MLDFNDDLFSGDNYKTAQYTNPVDVSVFIDSLRHTVLPYLFHTESIVDTSFILSSFLCLPLSCNLLGAKLLWTCEVCVIKLDFPNFSTPDTS